MSERFTVAYRSVPRTFFGLRYDDHEENRGGWVVRDWGKPITIGFATAEEAEQHKERIKQIYQRFNWE